MQIPIKIQIFLVIVYADNILDSELKFHNHLKKMNLLHP